MNRFSPLALLALALPFAAPAQAPHPAAPQQNGMGAMGHEHAPAKPSAQLMITLSNGQSKVFSLADLQGLSQATVIAFNAHEKHNQTFTGPLVADVLKAAGLALTHETEHDFLRSFVVATGTDAYWVLYSAAELTPDLHKAQTVIALTADGKPLTTSGHFQLVDPLDVKPARWVRNLTSLTVVRGPAAAASSAP